MVMFRNLEFMGIICETPLNSSLCETHVRVSKTHLTALYAKECWVKNMMVMLLPSGEWPAEM